MSAARPSKIRPLPRNPLGHQQSARTALMNLFDANTKALYARHGDEDRPTSLSMLPGLVPSGADVLDVGIGGGALGERLTHERGCRVDGVTLSEVEAANAAAHYRRIEVADLNDVDLSRLFAGQRYGAIVCADVLEHLERPTQVLDACRELLAEDGVLLLSVPNVAYIGLIGELLSGEFRYRIEGLLDSTHVRFFTRRSLLRMLRDNSWHVDLIEPLTLDLPESEFRPEFETLPPAVRRYLLALPDGLTYQFIVQARRAGTVAVAPDAPANDPDSRPAASYSLQLYLKNASGYSEDRKVVATARIGEERQLVRFALPPGSISLTGLRFDPADRPGFLHLFAMRLLDARGVPRWTWDGAVESIEAGDPHEVVFQKPRTAEHGAVLLLCGDDPFFELPIDAAQLTAGGEGATLEVDLAWPMSADYLLFVDQLKERRRREETLQCELVQARAAQQDASRQQLVEKTEAAAQRAAVERLERERAQLLEARAAREADLRRAAQEIASLTHALGHTYAAKDAAAEQGELLRKQVCEIEASRWFKMGAWIAKRLGRTGSPLVRSTASLLPAERPRALRPPRSGICIIVPVYRGLAETRTCVESVLRSASKARLRIVLINDASPEPEVTAYLREVAKRDPRVELIEHAANLGFVASVNGGMQQFGDDDIILLNSDTEVAGSWIDRLRDAAYREPGIATVTPFSNAATICSYPKFCVDSPMPADMSTAALDRYFASENAGQLIDIPTAVGFCMFIRRDCLDEVGLFDAERFGRGYGEENDFSMRAQAAGWRHVLALNTFVRHSGGVSFGQEKATRVQAAQELLAALHPDYAPLIARHLQQDPARPARLKVDLARIRASSLPSVLFVSHIGGGGTERHLRELADTLGLQANVFVLRPTHSSEFALEWLRSGEGFQLGFLLPAQYDALVEALCALGVVHIHYHHTRGQSPRVRDLPQSLGVTHDFTVHDFYSVCPQVTFSDENGRYCGEQGLEQCAECLKRRPAPDGASIDSWRSGFRPMIERARYVFAPSEDAAARLNRYYPTTASELAPHLDLDLLPPAPHPQPVSSERAMRVAVIGALSQIKGADVLEAAATLASQRGSRIEFHLIGFAYRKLRTPPEARLTVHGEYAEADLPALLDSIKPDLAWFPALWPETYSYTLSAALNARLPIVAPDLGAFPERLSGRPWTWICPWYRTPEDWVQFFEDLLREHFESAIAPASAPIRPTRAPRFSYTHNYFWGLNARVLTAPLSAVFLEKHRLGQIIPDAVRQTNRDVHSTPVACAVSRSSARV